MVRPAIASSRVAVTDDGQVRITLKQAYRDGTAAIEIPPKDFVLRLLAQVPLPKRKMISYFGVFASNAKLRSAVVPAGTKPRFKRKKPRKVMHDALHGEAKPANTEELAEVMSEEAAKRFSWADGLRRAFRLELLKCPTCGGKRRIVATIHDPKEIARFMRHLKLSPEPPDDLIAIRGPPEELLPPDQEADLLPDEAWDDDSWFGPDELPLAA